MAEILGAVGAGLALCTTIIQLSKKIHKSIKDIKGARDDVADLAHEAIIFAGLYQRFLHDCSGELRAHRSTASSTRRLESWTRTAIANLEKLLRSVSPLCPKPDETYTLAESFGAHWKWFFSKSFVKGLRASFSVARESINAFTSLTCIKKLDAQLQELRTALQDPIKRRKLEELYMMPIDVKIREVKQVRKNACEVYHTTKRVCRVANENCALNQPQGRVKEISPEVFKLQDFIKSSESYAKEILSPGKPTHRRRPPAPTQNHHLASISSSRSSSSCTSAISCQKSDDSSSLSTTVQKDRGNQAFVKHQTPGVQYNEYQGASREYMNDPYGHILSPPMVKSRSNSAITSASTEDRVLNRRQIGSHTIETGTRYIYINRHAFRIPDPSIVEAFIHALVRNTDKLEALCDVFHERSREDRRWFGIEGWLIVVHTSDAEQVGHFEKIAQISSSHCAVDGDFIWVDSHKLLPKDSNIRDNNLKIMKENDRELAALITELDLIRLVHEPGSTVDIEGWNMKLIIP